MPGGPVVPTWLAVAERVPGSVSVLVESLGRPITATVDARFANRAHADAPCCAATAAARSPGAAPPLGWSPTTSSSTRGPTALANLILLCVHHHNLVHRAGYRIQVAPEGGRPLRPGRRHAGALVPAPAAPADLPDPPVPGSRHTGTHERLRAFGADVILHDWFQARDGPTEFVRGTTY